MFGFIIRCFLTAGLLFSTVALFYSGYWGWGITLIFPTAIVIFSFFRNEQEIQIKQKLELTKLLLLNFYLRNNMRMSCF